MDDRTYTAAAERMSHLQRLQDENELLRKSHAYAVEIGDVLSATLDTALAERDSAFAEVDAHRRELAALRDERTRLLAANVRLFHDNNALRAELDAMRQAHSVIAARMAAMGC